LVAGSWILGEVTDGSSARYLATGWKGFACKAFGKGGFTGAISANESDSVTTVDTDGHIFN
jgi:hypothetical protein